MNTRLRQYGAITESGAEHGPDLRDMALEERREALASMIEPDGRMHPVQ
ncbi:hypothetical protein [Mesorhizobium sp. M0518]